MHGCDWVKSPHTLPPLAGAVTIERVDVCVPPPHAREQAPKPDQSPTTQSTTGGGHTSVLHACTLASAGHAAPPNAAGVTMVAVAVCVPPPHCWLQVENAEKAEITQSTGQGWELQGCTWTNTGHAAPPYSAVLNTVRDCCCSPWPHVFEHADQPDHADTMQSTGQGPTLHG